MAAGAADETRPTDPPPPFSGETCCLTCTRMAYYHTGESDVFCGYCCRKTNPKRQKLPVNPEHAAVVQERYAANERTVDEAAAANRALGQRGKLTCVKLRMLQNPVLEDGWLLVFPNNKHGGRKDGIGCASLSPMRLGPVPHGQPGLPPARCIENYHQFNKFFQGLENHAQFDTRRREAYVDPVPHRHKFPPVKIKRAGAVNANTPAYSIHLDRNGKERRYTYVQSRFFYCHWYERLAKKEDEFKVLEQLLDKGVNLKIAGYDAYPPTQDLYTHYCDASKPFGHELVLYTLLAVQPADYPWRKYYRLHRELYEPLSFDLE